MPSSQRFTATSNLKEKKATENKLFSFASHKSKVQFIISKLKLSQTSEKITLRLKFQIIMLKFRDKKPKNHLSSASQKDFS